MRILEYPNQHTTLLHINIQRNRLLCPRLFTEHTLHKKTNNITFIFAGLLALTFAFVITVSTQDTSGNVAVLSKITRDVLINIGVTTLAVTLINYLWGKSGGEPLSAQVDELKTITEQIISLKDTGLQKAIPTVSDASINWKHMIESSQYHIDLCGYQLLSLVDTQSILDLLVKKLNSGVKIRVLLPHPDSSWLRFAVSEHNLDAMRSNMKHTFEIFDRINMKQPHQKFELYQSKEHVIDASMRRFDDTMFIVHYLNGVNTPDSPVLVLKKQVESDCMYLTYIKWFESLIKIT